MLSGNIWLVVTLALLHNSGPISGFSFYHERENPKQELAPNSRDRIPDNLENELWKRNKKETCKRKWRLVFKLISDSPFLFFPSTNENFSICFYLIFIKQIRSSIWDHPISEASYGLKLRTGSGAFISHREWKKSHRKCWHKSVILMRPRNIRLNWKIINWGLSQSSP